MRVRVAEDGFDVGGSGDDTTEVSIRELRRVLDEHFSMKARPYPIQWSVFQAPFETIFATVQVLLNVALTVGKDKGQGWKRPSGFNVPYWVPVP